MCSIIQLPPNSFSVIAQVTCFFVRRKQKETNLDPRSGIATTNYGVTPLGQWLLMKEFCETRAHNDSIEINLILHPGSFSAGFHSQYTYHYFHPAIFRPLLETSIMCIPKRIDEHPVID